MTKKEKQEKLTVVISCTHRAAGFSIEFLEVNHVSQINKTEKTEALWPQAEFIPTYTKQLQQIGFNPRLHGIQTALC